MILPAILLLLDGVCGAAQSSNVSRARLVRQAQQTRLNVLDPTLPAKESLEAWFKRVAGTDAAVRWEVNDCGEATGTVADLTRNLPVCVEATAVLADKRVVSVSVLVEMQKTGPLPSAQFFDAYVAGGDGRPRTAASLSELAALLNVK